MKPFLAGLALIALLGSANPLGARDARKVAGSKLECCLKSASYLVVSEAPFVRANLSWQNSQATPVAAAFLQGNQENQSPAQSREGIFRIINFLIVAVALVYFLRRPLADFFADRNDAIRQGLEEGRKAMAASDARIADVEAKLKNLENEIAAFRAESEHAMVAERERLKQSAESEAQRLMEFAQSQIESAARAARADLKRYTAAQAVELAEAMIRQRMDDSASRNLVARFVHDLNPEVEN